MSEHYVVQSGEYSGRGVDGVFDTLDQAVEAVVKLGWNHYYDNWAGDIQVWEGESGKSIDVPHDHPLVTEGLRALVVERERRAQERAEAARVRREKERQIREERESTPRLFLTCEVNADGTVSREDEKEIRVGDSPLTDATAASWFLPGHTSVVVQAHGTDFDRVRKVYQDRVAETKARLQGVTGE